MIRVDFGASSGGVTFKMGTYFTEVGAGDSFPLNWSSNEGTTKVMLRIYEGGQALALTLMTPSDELSSVIYKRALTPNDCLKN